MIAYLDQQQRHLAPADAGDSAEPSATADDDALLRALDLQLSPDPSLAASDFGGIVRSLPAAVIRPGSADDVAHAVRRAARSARLTVAARGNGHSVAGQATAAGGLVLDLRALPLRLDLVSVGGEFFADVSAGALWEDILIWGVRRHGLAPASWTDYLRLTVGGTLSNGGISGQAFRWGPQVANVAELEVVTGDGERVVCSAAASPDLFFAALGGLGQFGVITRARIPLHPAPAEVKWIRVVYGEFEEYAGDAEWLVTRPESESFDYLEGFAFVNSVDDPVNGWATVPIPPGAPFDSDRVPAGSRPVLYCLEVTLHCYSDDDDDTVNERAQEMLRPLRYIRGLEFSAKVGYVEFLSRVKRAEEEARANGTWDGPHPWLNLLVGSRDIADFDRHVFKRILRAGIGGPMLVYPMLRSKWDPRMSVATPESEVFYLVALLRFAPPFPAGPAAEELVAQNREIVECCRSNSYDFKLYLPSYAVEGDWARHFGRDWPRFRDRKARYDPLALLAPGLRIFHRRPPPPLL